MTNHEGDVPAMPQPFIHNAAYGTYTDCTRAKVPTGFTQRQRAAIDLRVPDSGTPWIDDMIMKALRAEFAKAAMQGLLAASTRSSVIAAQAEHYARQLMAELEKGR